MANVAKVDCPAFLEQALNEAGYSSFDPVVRLPVEHRDIALINKIRSKQPGNRANRLIKARNSLFPQLGREIPAILSAGLLSQVGNSDARAEDTLAFDSVEKTTSTPIYDSDALWDIAASFGIDPSGLAVTMLVLLSSVSVAALVWRSFTRSKTKEPESLETTPLSSIPIWGENDFGKNYRFPNKLPELKCVTEQIFDFFVAGDSRTGKVRKENQDSISFCKVDHNTIVATVCDGAGGVPGGALAARTASAKIQSYILENLAGENCRRELLADAISHARAYASADKQQGITTAITFIFENNQIHYATVGDGGLLLVYPDGMVSELLVPHHVLDKPKNILAGYIGSGPHGRIAPRQGSVIAREGALLLGMTDGVSEILNKAWLARNRNELVAKLSDPEINPVKEILDHLETARDSKTERLLHSDNMSLVMCARN